MARTVTASASSWELRIPKTKKVFRHYSWQVRGKHRRDLDDPDDIPVPVSLVEILAEYRGALGLSPYPTAGERTPMIVSLYPQRDGWQPITRQRLFSICKGIFQNAAAAVAADQPEQARALESASTHWLRHTFVTHLLAHGVGIQDARDLARHRDIGSTQVYAHSEQERLAAIVEQFAEEQSQSSSDEGGGSSSAF